MSNRVTPQTLIWNFITIYFTTQIFWSKLSIIALLSCFILVKSLEQSWKNNKILLNQIGKRILNKLVKYNKCQIVTSKHYHKVFPIPIATKFNPKETKVSRSF